MGLDQSTTPSGPQELRPEPPSKPSWGTCHGAASGCQGWITGRRPQMLGRQGLRFYPHCASSPSRWVRPPEKHEEAGSSPPTLLGVGREEEQQRNPQPHSSRLNGGWGPAELEIRWGEYSDSMTVQTLEATRCYSKGGLVTPRPSWTGVELKELTVDTHHTYPTDTYHRRIYHMEHIHNYASPHIYYITVINCLHMHGINYSHTLHTLHTFWCAQWEDSHINSKTEIP